jgi:hypothetical protein
MTRQFNQQPRDDSRPPSRNVSSNRYQEEQSSRPARPRLNRAMVDRGWENGTPRNHPDYHPQSSNGQAPRNNWRKNQERGYSSYNGSTGNRTNDNRQSQPNYNQAQRSEPSSQSYSTPRKRPFDSKGYNAENRGFNNQQGDEPYSYNSRQGQNSQRQPQGRGSNFRAQEHSQGRFNDYGSNRRQPNQEHSNGYGNNRPQRNPERNKGRGYTSFNERSTYGDQEQREPHPRLQSRPEAFQRRQEGRRPQENQRYAPYREQFKGDYEQFGYDTPAQAESDARKPFRGNRQDRYGQHSIPYQNGHARKGPRLVQRKDAEFRASINEDAEELINRVHSSPHEHSPVHEEAASLPETTTENDSSEDLPLVFPDEQTKSSPAKKQTKHAINAGRTQKAEVAPPSSKGPRPSQRGYKWPAP